MSIDPGAHGADLRLTLAAGLSRYHLRELWQMVASHDHSEVDTHVLAWQKTEYLCRAMAKALRDVAVQLAQQWPPERSEASRAVIDRVRLLADAYDRLSQDSSTNSVYLRMFQWDNRTLQSDLRQLTQEWEATQARALARIRAAGLVVGVNGGEDELLRVTNLPPSKAALDWTVGPVADDWRLNLDTQARQKAMAYEQSVSGYEGRFVASEPISPTLDARSARAVSGPPSGSGASVGWSGSGSPAWVPDLDPAGGDTDTELDTGPGAGGGGVPGGPSGGGLPGGGAAPPPAGAGTVPWVPTAAGYAMAPGGVIGGSGAAVRPAGLVPVGGATPVSRPGTAGAASRGGFVAPPGGLIAGRPATVPGAGRAARRRPDDDQDFVVPDGGPGVLVPDPEPDEYSPGPGVIGIDR